MRRFWITAIVVFVLDQLTKLAVVHGLDLINRGEMDVFPPYLTFWMAWNYGINGGLLRSRDGQARVVNTIQVPSVDETMEKVLANGGQVVVRSTVGRGSTFIISLPATRMRATGA